MTRMGSAALLSAFIVALYAMAASLVGALQRRERVIRSAEVASHLVTFLLTLSSASLLYALYTRDFSLAYVYEYVNRALSPWYTATAFWAGQAGSLLFWGWTLGLSTSVVLWQNRRRERELMPWVNFVLSAVGTFFLLVLNFVSPPFERFPGPVQPDGYGLNPLLQNIGMVIHPPTLFLGYVGLTIPFAFGLAALIAGRVDEGWHLITRRWTVVSWFFLSLGIVLGAWWAYNVLGWGGYWAWDPVENASLLPWLTATGFLHSVMAQERRGMMKVWNMVLVMLSFFLVIFGTFVTRSGIIQSVHAFGKSNLGYFFGAFLVLIVLAGVGLLLWRWRLLATETRLESFFSRESGFLLNNLIFSAMTFTVFFGTLSPVISELATGNKITLSVAFYNRVMIPAAILLFLLMAVCPLLRWRQGPGSLLPANAAVPLAALASGAGVAAYAGFRDAWAVLAFGIALALAVVVVREVARGTRARARGGESLHLALGRLLGANRRRYGGYLIHLSMAVMFLGIAGSAMNRETSATLAHGERMQAGAYVLVNDDIKSMPEAQYQTVKARVKVLIDEKFAGYLYPELRYYNTQDADPDKPHTEVATRSTWREDLYAILNGYNIRTGEVTLRILINPLVPWIWMGCVILSAGSLFLLWPERRKAEGGGA